ncbi:hypothetical protein MDOR_03440 [Mycolicibacterium doricum]|uniref:Uncharacterized protein n=1 Tax=Mycolicibacterium doricum TaxID=126673 RepID=A0A7I7VP90_9MYCO|nr:hypothetical protein MDOR_03440 [Mycolicibacterium doricum]
MAAPSRIHHKQMDGVAAHVEHAQSHASNLDRRLCTTVRRHPLFHAAAPRGRRVAFDL